MKEEVDWRKCPNIIITQMNGRQLKVCLLMTLNIPPCYSYLAFYNISERSVFRTIKEFKKDEGFIRSIRNSQQDTKKNFTKVPNIAIKNLRPNELLVYAYIRSKITIENYDFAASRIAKDIQLGVRAIERQLKALEDLDYISRKRIAGRRIKYRLLPLDNAFRESIFEKAKKGYYRWPTDDLILFQEFLMEHNKHFTQECAHTPLKDTTIREKTEELLEYLLERYDGNINKHNYRQEINYFLNYENNADAHFPVFVRYIGAKVDPYQFFS